MKKNTGKVLAQVVITNYLQTFSVACHMAILWRTGRWKVEQSGCEIPWTCRQLHMKDHVMQYLKMKLNPKNNIYKSSLCPVYIGNF